MERPGVLGTGSGDGLKLQDHRFQRTEVMLEAGSD